MTTDNKLKTCIECRAGVPFEAELCPECGYPFDDTKTGRCSACNNIIVADVDNCPVCDQQVVMPQAPPVESSDYQYEGRPEVSNIFEQSEPTEQAVVQQQAAAVLVTDSSGNPELDTIRQAIQELANAMQANNKINDDIVRMVIDSNKALQRSIQENQVQNQNALQQSVDLIRVVYESLGAGAGANTILPQVATDLKIALVEIASQQAAGSSMVISAIKEASERTPGGLPRSIRWLDYMFVAMIMMVIFTVVNMMVVAYMVRVLLME